MAAAFSLPSSAHRGGDDHVVKILLGDHHDQHDPDEDPPHYGSVVDDADADGEGEATRVSVEAATATKKLKEEKKAAAAAGAAADDGDDGYRNEEEILEKGGGKEAGVGFKEEKERKGWSKKREYVLTMMGYIVGIGNVWRFPYLCNRNGGGAFLFPFIISVAFLGFPLFFLETALGQFTGRSPLHVWSICPLMKGVGIAMCMLSATFVWYYSTIMAWALYYLVSSFKSVVPWSLCGEWWNTPHCMDVSRRRSGGTSASENVTSDWNATSVWNATYVGNDTSGWNFTSSDMRGNNTEPLNTKVVTAAEEFWQHNVLQVSSGLHEPGHVVWYLAIMQCVVVLFLFLALSKGVRSAGKVVYVTATAPYILLIVLLVRGATLPGAVDGILFYLTPDFKRLLDPLVWVEAALQVFYSLGPGWGGLIAIASYNKFENNCFRDALMLSFLGEGTSLFGGFAIFSILGYMAHQIGVPVSEVVSSGPGLAFIVYPEAISMLPLPQLWAILFFFMMVTLVIDTQIAGAETVLTVLCDTFPKVLGRRRILVTAVFCLIALVSSLILVSQGGIYLFQLFDWFIATITLTSVVLLECLIIAWVYGADRFGEDIRMMIGRKPPMIINVLWCFLNPVWMMVLLVVILARYEPPTYGDYHYDAIGTAVGWVIALSSFVPIPVLAVHQLLKAKGSFVQRLKRTTTPDEHWGPADPARRLLYRKHLLERKPRQHWLDVLR